MQRSLPLLALLSVCLFVPSSVHADTVTYLSQNRFVDARGSATDSQTSQNDFENDVAADFGPFQSAAGVSVVLGGAIGSGTGIQSSTLQPYRIDASGSHSANGEGWEPKAFGDGIGESRFEVVFQTVGSCAYDISGYIEAFDSGYASLLLEDAVSGSNVEFLEPPFNGTLDVAESGTLPAGDYRLKIRCVGSAYGDEFFYDYASGAYDITVLFGGAVGAPLIAASGVLAAAPNPFVSSTKIRWSSPAFTPVDLRIFDVQGRLVATFASRDTRTGSVEWDGRDASGRSVPAGVYFVRLDDVFGSQLAKVVRSR